MMICAWPSTSALKVWKNSSCSGPCWRRTDVVDQQREARDMRLELFMVLCRSACHVVDYRSECT
jgi:hypothetical protein